VTLKDIGLRLKGNSSLMGLRKHQRCTTAPAARAGPFLPTAPNTLPWLVRLDKNIDGQSL
jgi:hypothetical protein